MKINLFNNIVVFLFLLLLANVSFAEQPNQGDEDFTNENNNKITIELKPDTNEYALGAAKVVHDFYFEHFKNMYERSSWATNKYLSPKTRQIFSMLNFIIWDYDFIIDGQDCGNIWKINKVDVINDKAELGLENSWDGEGKRNLKISCINIKGKWFVNDISDVTNSFYSFLNSNSNLAVVTKNELPISSNKYRQTKLTFYDRNNRIIPLKNCKLGNNYTIDFAADSPDNLSEKIDSKLLDSDWTVKATDVIPFSFFNKIKKGEDKYLAYIVLGEPSEESSNKLFYSPDDYISYDTEGKITSWNGFEDSKEFFDDGTGSDNQNIGYINAKSGINLRKEPNTKSEKVCGFPFNTKVIIFDKNGPQATFENITSNWYLITDGTKVGWAFGGFIRDFVHGFGSEYQNKENIQSIQIRPDFEALAQPKSEILTFDKFQLHIPSLVGKSVDVEGHCIYSQGHFFLSKSGNYYDTLNSILLDTDNLSQDTRELLYEICKDGGTNIAMKVLVKEYRPKVLKIYGNIN